jgi:UDPglucose 6-dehydrogenase
MTEARRIFGDEPRISYATNPDAALEGADALAIVTEWKEFRSPDFVRIARTLKTPVIFDGRNLYEPQVVRDAGVDYQPIGRV